MLKIVNLKYLLWLFFILSLQAYAYKPTVESLLRNSLNPSVEDKSVIANLTVSSINTDIPRSEQEELEGSVVQDTEEDNYVYSFKMYFLNQGEKTKQFFQVNFSNNNFSDSSVDEVTSKYPYNLTSLGFNEENKGGMFFYSVMQIIFNNDPSFIIELLNNHFEPIAKNEKMRNNELLHLLNRYKEYLRVSEEEQDLENPLKSKDPMIQEEINKLLASSFYKDSPFVALKREKTNFLWSINHPNLKAKIDHKSRQIKEIVINSSTESFRAIFKDYIIINGINLVPSVIRFNLNGKESKLVVSKLQVYDENQDSFSRWLSRTKEMTQESNNQKASKPDYIL